MIAISDGLSALISASFFFLLRPFPLRERERVREREREREQASPVQCLYFPQDLFSCLPSCSVNTD